MKTAPILLILLGLAGCAEFSAVRTTVATQGAQAADEALSLAKWQTCQAATIGSLERELGGDKERIAGWILWCAKKPANSPLQQLTPAPATAQPQSMEGSLGPGVKRAIW